MGVFQPGVFQGSVFQGAITLQSGQGRPGSVRAPLQGHGIASASTSPSIATPARGRRLSVPRPGSSTA